MTPNELLYEASPYTIGMIDNLIGIEYTNSILCR